MNGKTIISKLKAEGCVLDRISGSHHIMVKDGKATPIPVHGKRKIGTRLLTAIQEQTGIKFE